MINFIKNGENTKDATATPDDILSPKTAYVNGEKITGNIQSETINLAQTVANYMIPYQTDYNTAYGMSFDRQYLFALKTPGSNLVVDEIYIYKQDEENNYNLIKTYTATELDITIGPYIFSVGNWGLFNDPNKLLITLKQSPYYSSSYGIVFDKSTESLSHSNTKTMSTWNAYGWSHANPIKPNIVMDVGGLYNFKESNITRLSTWSQPFDTISNFSCEGRFISVVSTKGTSTIVRYLNSTFDSVIKSSTASNIIFPNTIGTYAFVDGVLKSFTIDEVTGEFSYEDLDFTVTAPSKFIIWFDSLVYAAVIDAPNVEKQEYYDLNFYVLDPTNQKTMLVLQARGLQNNDESFRNLNSGNFGNGIITTYSDNQLQVVYVENNAVFTTELEYKDNKYYSLYDTDVLANDILSGKTFYNTNGKQTGTMSNNGNVTVVPSTQQQTKPNGYYNSLIIEAVNNTIDSNIVATNIKKDVQILGVTGTYEGNTVVPSKKKLSELQVGDVITKVRTKNCIPIFSPTLGVGVQLIKDSTDDTHTIELNPITTDSDYDTLNVTIFEDTSTVLYKYYNSIWTRESVEDVTLTTPITVGTITSDSTCIAGLDDVLEFELQV